jgi:hypothetical protein
MSTHPKPMIARRDVLRALTAGAVAATAASAPLAAAEAEVKGKSDKSGRARYQADSAEVQTFYRVNRYPKCSGRHTC